MAAIRQSRHISVVSSGNRLFVFRNGVKEELEIPDAPVEENKNTKKKDSSKDGMGENCRNWILASAFSKSGTFFAVCDDQKQLHLYRTSPKWELISSRIVARRCTAVTFTNCESEVIIADRSGDVYRFTVEGTENEGQLLQGHLSMLLDVVLTKDDRYIVTCDRDEKIRVSHYPNAYNIHTFCLKHTEFVSQLLYVEKFDCLLSSSGDGTICLWNLSGKLLQCVSCKRALGHRKLQGQGSTNGEGGPDVKGHMDGSQESLVEGTESLAIKRMVYDEQLNILAVLFFNSTCVSFYSLSHSDTRIYLEELDPTLDTSFHKELWDVSFDSKHRLWILQASESNAVQVFRCAKDGSQLQLVDISRDEDVSGTVDLLNSSWEFFSASLTAPTLYSVLQKTKYDNMKVYMERKNERLGGKKLKQNEQKKEEQCEPSEKKLKVS